MLKILTGEVSKGYRKKMIIQKNIKENKYAQMKRFNYDHQLQFYMYDFVYVNPVKMPVADYFLA